MLRRAGRCPLPWAAFLLVASACQRVPPRFDVPPVLLNRDEVIEALHRVTDDLEAEILLLVRVDELGRVEEVRVAVGSGDQRLDSWAVWAGKQMRFTPAQYRGRSVPSVVRVPVTFDVPPPMTQPPVLLNADSVASWMALQYPDLRGSARLRLRVGTIGQVSELRAIEVRARETRDAAVALAQRMRFRPAFHEDKPVPFWVVAVFEFAGDESRASIEPPGGEEDETGNFRGEGP